MGFLKILLDKGTTEGLEGLVCSFYMIKRYQIWKAVKHKIEIKDRDTIPLQLIPDDICSACPLA